MRHALAVSSDVYFYEVGGGFEGQKGLGIAKIDEYMKLFGLSEDMDMPFFKSVKGNIPSPEWKKANFNGDPWRVGDTYLTSIGQYGFQVTPIQMIRAISTIATAGTRIEPTILHNDTTNKQYWQSVPLSPDYYKVVQEGMRLGVTEGVATALNDPTIHVAAKTGTAELGVSKDYVNSWVTGFFPYEHPRYAFVVIMEHGLKTNLVGASAVMKGFLESMKTVAPEYLSK